MEMLTRNDIISLSKEHAALAKQQYEALQKSSYVNMSQTEADEYNKRRIRIGELCEILSKFRPHEGT
ncbi:MAG TPA: hypothetical protein VK578_12530 [Edaphobacter sp.]|nr:hypothetical protein [Edaphobacter sp.]